MLFWRWHAPPRLDGVLPAFGLDFGDVPPLPLRRSDVGWRGIGNKARWESECYSWPGKSHLGDWANNDASAVHRHPLEMMVISAQALRGTFHPVVALEAQTQVAEQSTRSCSRRRKCWVPECPPSRDSAPSHDGTPGAFPTVARKAPSLD